MNSQKMTQPAATLPPSVLMELIISLLIPFLTVGCITDQALARRAAQEAIAAYQAAGQHHLLSIAQIVAFAMTALDNLRLSLPEDLSLSRKLRLRSNANALNRSSQRTAALKTAPQARPHASPPDPAPPEPAPQPPQASPADQAWAEVMNDVAAEYTAELASLPQAQRRIHLDRINALSTVASELATGKAPPLKARLLSTTSLYTPPTEGS